MYPSQVTALSSPRVTNILTYELVLLVFELKWNNTECTLLCWTSFIMFVSFKHIFECGCSSFLFLYIIPLSKNITHRIYPFYY